MFSNDLKLNYMILKVYSSVLTQKGTWKRQMLNISFMLKNNCFQIIWNLHDPEAFFIRVDSKGNLKETNTKYSFYVKEQLFSNDLKLTYMILKLFSFVLTQKGTWKRQILNISFMLKNNCFQMIWNLLTWSWSFFHSCWLKREPERDKY